MKHETERVMWGEGGGGVGGKGGGRGCKYFLDLFRGIYLEIKHLRLRQLANNIGRSFTDDLMLHITMFW